MFESLSDRLTRTVRGLAGKRLTETNIQDALRDVRRSLLEADVALDVVSSFIASVRQRAIGEEVISSLNAHDAFVKVVHRELVELMGVANDTLDLAAAPPVVVLMAGLQGSGKTTTVAKLARFLRERERKKVAVVSADVYRPAAIDQLQILADEVQARFISSTPSESPVDIVDRALVDARTQFDDVLIVDTAGRLSIDEEMMAEIALLHGALTPVETLFVVDAMTGQDAALTSKAFDEAIPLTGVILTKADGDARGGAALSIRAVTGKPIKFIGTGEKSDELEAFHPDRVASRILGMGDVLTLIEEVERKVDKKKTSRLARKIKRGRKFDLEDFREQLSQMAQLGGMSNMLDKLPGAGMLTSTAQGKVDDEEFTRLAVMIDSMTVHERRFPDVINGSRKRRIASGSGSQVQDVNRLLKQHKQMQKMMKKVTRRGGMEKMMRGLEQPQSARRPQRRR
ncbi:MAG: signal recognition particle protein [Pseudomonadales bacterium]|nr:signal recognition particle protein [Pseudomonadales bacterium]